MTATLFSPADTTTRPDIISESSTTRLPPDTLINPKDLTVAIIMPVCCLSDTQP